MVLCCFSSMRKKLKSLNVTILILGTKFGGVLLLRMRHQAMQLVVGRLAGCKMWQTRVKN